MAILGIDTPADQILYQCLCLLQTGVLDDVQPRCSRVLYSLDKRQLGGVEAAGHFCRAPVGVTLLDLVGRKVRLRCRAVHRRFGGAEVFVVLC